MTPNLTRLEDAAHLMRTLDTAAHPLDMDRFYADPDPEGKYGIPRCQTAACCIGWGVTLLPHWREAGLTLLKKTGTYTDSWEVVFTAPDTNNSWMGFEAVSNFMGIPTAHVRLLFGWLYDDLHDPKPVAERIEKYVAACRAAGGAVPDNFTVEYNGDSLS